MPRLTHAAATCSWIDPATGLPETEEKTVVFPTTNAGFLQGKDGYRFCNFMSVYADYDEQVDRFVAKGFDTASAMYRGPSFLGIPSHAFMISQDIFEETDAIRFTQVTGARTVSPEVGGAAAGLAAGAAAGAAVGTFVFPAIGTAIGALTGAAIGLIVGEIAGHQFMGFPPIWTKIQIRIRKDGWVEAELLQHSLFPSMTFYQRRQLSSDGPVSLDFDIVAQAPASSTYYNATKDVELPDWQARGWGQLSAATAPGPTYGNPWGIEKGVGGVATSVPGG